MDSRAQPSGKAPKAWTEALDQGRVEIASGRTVHGEAFLQRLEREDAQLSSPERQLRGTAANL